MLSTATFMLAFIGVSHALMWKDCGKLVAGVLIQQFNLVTISLTLDQSVDVLSHHSCSAVQWAHALVLILFYQCVPCLLDKSYTLVNYFYCF